MAKKRKLVAIVDGEVVGVCDVTNTEKADTLKYIETWHRYAFELIPDKDFLITLASKALKDG